MVKSFIELRNVGYRIGNRQILKDINLKISSDERVGLIGYNGAGKTTLCQLIIGILKPTEGKILIDGEDVSKLPLHKIGRKIGFLFQNPSSQIFAPHIREELGFSMKYRGIDEMAIEERVDEMIQRLSLESAVETPTYYMSQGEKQRLAIGALLLNDPGFLILDEPTTGLDQKRKDSLGELLMSLEQNRIGMLLISHDHKFIRQNTSRVICLENGSVQDE